MTPGAHQSLPRQSGEEELSQRERDLLRQLQEELAKRERKERSAPGRNTNWQGDKTGGQPNAAVGPTPMPTPGGRRSDPGNGYPAARWPAGANTPEHTPVNGVPPYGAIS